MTPECEVETEVIRAMNRALPIRVSVRLYESRYLHTVEGGTSTETTTRSLIRSWLLPVDDDPRDTNAVAGDADGGAV